MGQIKCHPAPLNQPLRWFSKSWHVDIELPNMLNRMGTKRTYLMLNRNVNNASILLCNRFVNNAWTDGLWIVKRFFVAVKQNFWSSWIQSLCRIQMDGMLRSSSNHQCRLHRSFGSFLTEIISLTWLSEIFCFVPLDVCLTRQVCQGHKVWFINCVLGCHGAFIGWTVIMKVSWCRNFLWWPGKRGNLDIIFHTPNSTDVSVTFYILSYFKMTNLEFDQENGVSCVKINVFINHVPCEFWVTPQRNFTKESTSWYLFVWRTWCLAVFSCGNCHLTINFHLAISAGQEHSAEITTDVSNFWKDLVWN